MGGGAGKNSGFPFMSTYTVVPRLKMSSKRRTGASQPTSLVFRGQSSANALIWQAYPYVVVEMRLANLRINESRPSRQRTLDCKTTASRDDRAGNGILWSKKLDACP